MRANPITRIAVVPLFALGLLAGACADAGEPATGAAPTGRGALQPLDGCDALEAAVRQRLFERVDAELQQNLERVTAFIAREDYCCSEVGFEDPTCVRFVYNPYAPGGPEGGGGAECAGGMCGTPTPSGGGGASEYSTTNDQVAGVHEADLVKNDGRYIYLLAGAELRIFAAWPAAQTHLLSRVELVGAPRSLLVDGDRAVVFSALDSACALDQRGEELVISVLDIADRSAPRLERELWINGALLQARRVEHAVRAVVAFPEVSDAGLRPWPEELTWLACGVEVDAQAVLDGFQRQRQRNAQVVRTMDVRALLPRGRDRDLDGRGGLLRDAELFPDCQGFYASDQDGGLALLSLLTLRTDADQHVDVASVLSAPGVVYAAAESIYVAVTRRGARAADAGGTPPAERTAVHKFALDQHTARASYRASGEVAGRPLNQLSMDEHHGQLRIATTEGYLPDPETSNNVFILEERGAPPGQLHTVGALTGLAPTEDIRAARFDGARGFLVTFKKTDPLFVFDLSDPGAPRVEGELHIPGFSTYLHFIDPDHLLSIGFDADDQGSFAWFTGVMLQLFDVSDPTAPRLLHREVIGTRGTTSDATGDHLAFNYFAARGLLAVPMGICEESSGAGSYGTEMSFSGLLVYRVDVEQGFTLLGGVDHLDPSGAVDASACSNWWTSPDSQVKRSVFLEDFVYSISRDQLKVSALGALDAPLASFELPQLDPLAVSCW